MAKTKNDHTIRFGNRDGEIKFGHIDLNEVKSSVMLRSGAHPQVAEHYMQFNSNGPMKGGTINRCPGSYQIWCGNAPTDGVAFVLNAVDGDIVIRAQNGRIRMEAENIDMMASGADNRNGVITLKSDEKVQIITKNFELNSSSMAKFFSSGIVDIVGKTILNIYGGLIEATDGATSIARSQVNSALENREA